VKNTAQTSDAGNSSELAELRARMTQFEEAHRKLRDHVQQMEAQAENHAQLLLHADRLAKLGTLSAGIAHEINTPLTYIGGHASVLQVCLSKLERIRDQLPADSPLSADLAKVIDQVKISSESINEGTQRITSIVNSMMKFSRRTTDEPAPCSLRQVIDESLNLCHNSLKYHVTVVNQVPHELPTVLANIQQLSQVFVNLFQNAADAMRARGDGTLTLLAEVGTSSITVRVEDTGTGIDPQHMSSIWESFFTTKGPDEGMGLGLAICKAIVENHNGRIWAENRPEGGARFFVELPILERTERGGPHR
jgi:signal transduction histidine kinase